MKRQRLKNSKPDTRNILRTLRSKPQVPEGYREAEKKYVELANKEYTVEELRQNLTYWQQEFCKEYIITKQATKAYDKVRPGRNDNKRQAAHLMSNRMIKQYIKYLQGQVEEVVGVCKEMQLAEFRKIAYANIADLHNTWTELKDFERIRTEQPDIMAAIESIETKTTTMMQYCPELDRKAMVRVDYVKIKMHDKIRALESINRVMGYNAPEVVEHTVKHTLNTDNLDTDTFQQLLLTARKQMQYGEEQKHYRHHPN